MPIYMKIEGIDGDVTAKGHEKWIEVLSFSWGASNAASSGHGGGGGSGKVNMQDFHFVHSVDKASPKLLEAVCSGRVAPSAMLGVSNSGEPGGDGTVPNRGSDYLIIKLKEVFISSISPGANSATDEDALEAVSLNFSSLESQYIAPNGEVVRGTCP